MEDKKKFGWKRKIGANVSKSVSTAFADDSKDDDEEEEVDWLSLVPLKRPNVIGLEDAQAKGSRLVQEGTVLASSERYWEALKKWDEALLYLPGDSKIHEMKSQALMELCEVYPAVQSAMKAIECEPTWYVAHQTLGRAHLGLGEVRLALKSFSRAVHLNPGDKELWEDDLIWAYSLLQKKQRLDEEKRVAMDKQTSSVQITELNSATNDQYDSGLSTDIEVYTGDYSEDKKDTKKEISDVETDRSAKRIKKLPKNYIQMRDPT